MSADGDNKSVVGYRLPPTEHQFKKGKSGNARGRPPKYRDAERKSAAHMQLEDILLAEALRPIQIREGDQVIEMPMIQAVIRSMGVAAVKGNHKAQLNLASMVQSAQAKRYEDLMEQFSSAFDYKEYWLEIFEDCDRRGVPRPDPLPHPDDIAVNAETFEVIFNGPISLEHKIHWDKMLAQRQDCLDIIAECRQALKRSKKGREVYEDDIANQQRLVDLIGGIIPDEKTRRAPGFDIDEWRDRNGVLEKLKRKHAKRSRKRP